MHLEFISFFCCCCVWRPFSRFHPVPVEKVSEFAIRRIRRSSSQDGAFSASGEPLRWAALQFPLHALGPTPSRRDVPSRFSILAKLKVKLPLPIILLLSSKESVSYYLYSSYKFIIDCVFCRQLLPDAKLVVLLVPDVNFVCVVGLNRNCYYLRSWVRCFSFYVYASYVKNHSISQRYKVLLYILFK